jgi:hypothetical protein
LLNLLQRNFEHVDASIVAFVSGCGSSAEIIARAAVEFSVNIIYILAGDRGARLIAYFNHYLDGVDRQIERWRSEIDQLTPDQAKIHNLGIKQRRAANDVLRQWVSALGVHSMEPWPTQIEQRFRAIGASSDYRTFYARMSSEAHADAEETLRYFVAKVTANDSLLEAMALETVWTSRFYIYFAASFFLYASLAYSRSYKLPLVEPRLRKGLADVERELIAISSHIGADI